MEMSRLPQNKPNLFKAYEMDVGVRLHKAIRSKDITEIREVLAKNPHERNFYDIVDNSALKATLVLENVEIYEILLTSGLSLGPHEDFLEICKNMSEENRKKLRIINLKYFRKVCKDDKSFFVRNSYVANDFLDCEVEQDLISETFDILSNIPAIQPILKIIEASQKLSIIFDFKNYTIQYMDPAAYSSTTGQSYSDGVIYIGARRMVHSATAYDVLGSLARYLCHYAIHLTFENDAKPYGKEDYQSAVKFQEILNKCQENHFDEEIINEVFHQSPNHQHDELIVRVPKLIAMYRENPKKLMAYEKHFGELFEYFKEFVVVEMEKKCSKMGGEKISDIFSEKSKCGKLNLRLKIAIKNK